MAQQGNGNISDGNFYFSSPYILWLEFIMFGYEVEVPVV